MPSVYCSRNIFAVKSSHCQKIWNPGKNRLCASSGGNAKGQTFSYVSEAFYPFSVSSHRLESRDMLRRARVALASDGFTTSLPGHGCPRPSVELKPVLYKDRTKLKSPHAPGATLEMAASKSDKGRPGLKFGQGNQADQFNFLFPIGFAL